MSAIQTLKWAVRAATGVEARSAAECLWRVRDLAARSRNKPGSARFGDRLIAYVDGPSCYHQLAELFVEGCHDFESADPKPRIIDCGGNIGLSVARFRRLHPLAEITVLEADEKIAEVLRTNLRTWGDSETRVEAAAAWIHDGEAPFDAAGADAGRLSDAGDHRVPCLDIAKLCDRPVDLLKLDIEGAEYAVMDRLRESGAIDQVKRIVCEAHERADSERELHRLLGGLAEAGFRYQITQARSAPWLDDEPSGSGFRRAPVRGSLAMIHAWRPER